MELKKYKPFEKYPCPVSGVVSELDPVFGYSLDGLAIKARRGEIEFPIPWALHPQIGFETRFHGKKVSNITFQTLHAGMTKGSMLVNFAEDEAWMRNLGEIGREETPNHWAAFLSLVISGLEVTYLPESDEEDEWFNFQFQVLVNSQPFSVRPPTIAGCVVDVVDSFENTVKPCEIPITFRDADWILTASHHDVEMDDDIQSFSVLTERFFDKLKENSRVALLIEKSKDVPWDTYCRYFGNGHGVLGCLKGERERLGLNLPIPQLEIREFESACL